MDESCGNSSEIYECKFFCKQLYIKCITFCLVVCRFESSITIADEDLAGELWLRCGCWLRFDDRLVIHVQDFVEVDSELEEVDDILRIGVFDGQSTHEVEWR